MNKKYDVTMLVSPTMAVYKNKEEKKPVFSVASNIERGDSSNETQVSFNVHSGTHVDFPLHVNVSGLSSRDFDITTFIRKVRVLDFTDVVDSIAKAHLLTKDIVKDDFILLKTRNSFEEEFNFNFVYLKKDAAQYLSEIGISGIGIDSLGIERNQPDHPTHHILMNAGIWILEGLRLREVSENTYNMTALPLKLDNVDALPLTVILEEI